MHLGYGLAAILGFIGVKLVLHWAHGIWPATPEVPTLASLGVIVAILAVVTGTSLRATSGAKAAPQDVEERTVGADVVGAADEPAERPAVPEPARGPGSRCGLDLRVAGT